MFTYKVIFIFKYGIKSEKEVYSASPQNAVIEAISLLKEEMLYNEPLRKDVLTKIEVDKTI